MVTYVMKLTLAKHMMEIKESLIDHLSNINKGVYELKT
jgi:hypothetical protein